jgi:hypothetical protein
VCSSDLIVTLGQTGASLIGLTNVYSTNVSGSNITASGLLHGTNISAATSITIPSGYITAGSPAGAPNTPGAIQGALGFFTSATLGSVNITNDMTVGGNLTVNGTTTTINTQNLNVSDRFILLSSGSTSANDGGIIIQSATNGTGFAFLYDQGQARWAYTGSLSGTATTAAPDAFAAMVIDLNVAESTDKAVYQKNGNIKVEVGGDIYIYA